MRIRSQILDYETLQHCEDAEHSLLARACYHVEGLQLNVRRPLRNEVESLSAMLLFRSTIFRQRNVYRLTS